MSFALFSFDSIIIINLVNCYEFGIVGIEDNPKVRVITLSIMNVFLVAIVAHENLLI